MYSCRTQRDCETRYSYLTHLFLIASSIYVLFPLFWKATFVYGPSPLMEIQCLLP